nr:hypothetical protein Iba_scaffold1029760CG0010 [Ipomoea batatas]
MEYEAMEPSLVAAKRMSGVELPFGFGAKAVRNTVLHWVSLSRIMDSLYESSSQFIQSITIFGFQCESELRKPGRLLIVSTRVMKGTIRYATSFSWYFLFPMTPNFCSNLQIFSK